MKFFGGIFNDMAFFSAAIREGELGSALVSALMRGPVLPPTPAPASS